MYLYKLTPHSRIYQLFRSFPPFSHILYMKMYTGRMASAVGTKRDSSSENWGCIQYRPQSKIYTQTTNLVNSDLCRFNCDITSYHHTIRRRCTRCRKVIRQSWIPIRIHAIPEAGSPLWWVSFFHSISRSTTHRPLLNGTPKANDLKQDLTIWQIPHDLKTQSAASLVPRSQMHWELWKLRTSS